MTLSIAAVDVRIPEQVTTWNQVLRDGFNAGREAAWWASDESTLARLGAPEPGSTRIQLLATLEGAPVGAAGAEAEEGEPAEIEISVLPAHRRQGIGTALARALREHLGGAADLAQAEVYSDAGIAFARSQGLELGNQEHRLIRDLPVDLADLRSHAREGDPSLELRSWVGACPEDLVEDWARLTTQMEADVPLGNLTRPVPSADVEKIRRSEQSLARQGWALVRSLALLDGVSVGFTQIMLNTHDPLILTQDDTIVERTHRGRGIGRALKIANLERLAEVPEARDSRWLQSYVDLGNDPMLALNRLLGFREADLLTILEGPLARD